MIAIFGLVIAVVFNMYPTSVLPVWLLLQPRDYLNSHQLITGLTLLTLGLVVLHPTVQAPAAHEVGDAPSRSFLVTWHLNTSIEEGGILPPPDSQLLRC